MTLQALYDEVITLLEHIEKDMHERFKSMETDEVQKSTRT